MPTFVRARVVAYPYPLSSHYCLPKVVDLDRYNHPTVHYCFIEVEVATLPIFHICFLFIKVEVRSQVGYRTITAWAYHLVSAKVNARADWELLRPLGHMGRVKFAIVALFSLT